MLGRLHYIANYEGQADPARTLALNSLVLDAGVPCVQLRLSPIFPSEPKPGYGPALGPAALAGAPLPTWALGGVSEANAGECLRSGAAGVAVMGSVLRSPDPAATVAKIQARLAEVLR